MYPIGRLSVKIEMTQQWTLLYIYEWTFLIFPRPSRRTRRLILWVIKIFHRTQILWIRKCFHYSNKFNLARCLVVKAYNQIQYEIKPCYRKIYIEISLTWFLVKYLKWFNDFVGYALYNTHASLCFLFKIANIERHITIFCFYLLKTNGESKEKKPNYER